MAVMVGNQVKLNNGQLVTPQTGGWYDAAQYWNGTLSSPGQINTQSNQPGAGSMVPDTVVAATNPANVAYVKQQQQTYKPPSGQPTPQVGGGGAAPTSVTGTAGTLGAAPTIDLNSITNAAYNTPEITAANKAISDRQSALVTAQTEINDNPFYSEATRVGKLKSLVDQSNSDITVQQNQLASLKADAAIKVNAATGQYNIDNAAYQQKLSTFNQLVSAGGLANASPADLATYAVEIGVPVSMLSGIQQTQAEKNITTQMVTADDGTISFINSKTGEIVSQTNPGVGGTKTLAGSKTTKADVVGWAKTDAASGKTLDDMIAYYEAEGGLTRQEIFNLYMNANYYKNTPDEIAAAKAKYGVK